MKSIKAGNRIFWLKFGLKSLITLDDFSYSNRQEENTIKFYLALNEPSLSIKEAEEIMSQLDCDVEELLDEVMRDSLGGAIDDTSALSIKEQVEELYSLAVGQCGISPQVFFDLTPHEIELIYLGYLKNKELEVNLNALALRRSKLKESQPINLFGEECSPSTMSKRKETFSSLGIE